MFTFPVVSQVELESFLASEYYWHSSIGLPNQICHNTRNDSNTTSSASSGKPWLRCDLFYELCSQVVARNENRYMSLFHSKVTWKQLNPKLAHINHQTKLDVDIQHV